MNQHFVSRVLLNRFADGKPLRIGVLDLDSRTTDSKTAKRIAALEDFVIKGSNKTETTWQKVERALPEAFSLMEQRRILESPKFLDCVRDCIALHFARSFAFDLMYGSQRQAKQQQVFDNLLAQFLATRIVRELTGVEVPPLSAPSLARELIARKFDEDLHEKAFAATLLLQMYQQGRELAANAELEFWYATDELLMGDLPATSYDKPTDRVGLLNGVAWGDATALFMPLGPHHAVALSKRAAYLDANARTVEWMNVTQVRGAYREIYFRPQSGLDEVIIKALGPANA